MLYNQGVDLMKIQQLIGHKSALTTERYLGVKFEETGEAILMLDGPLTQVLNTSVALGSFKQLSETSLASVN